MVTGIFISGVIVTLVVAASFVLTVLEVRRLEAKVAPKQPDSSRDETARPSSSPG